MDDINIDNITRRKKRQGRSPESLDGNNSFNSAASERGSCENLALLTPVLPQYIEQLKNELMDLKKILDYTQDKLKNVVEENRNLTKQVFNMQEELNSLKQLCRSPFSGQNLNSCSNSNEAPKQRIEKRNSIFPDTLTYNINSPNKQKISKQKQNRDKVNNDLEESRTLGCNVQNFETKLTQTRHDKRKILILGSQQCSGLAQRINESRRNSKYEEYEVTSFVRPNAVTEDILQSSDHKNFTPKDKLILCVGENDSNPTNILIELSAFLKNNSNLNIIVLSISQNKYLNVSILNKYIRNICNHFQNCKFHDITSLCTVKSGCLDHLSKNINLLIDCIDYDEKYLNFDNISYSNNQKVKTSSTKKTRAKKNHQFFLA